jgi:hypothetical protein
MTLRHMAHVNERLTNARTPRRDDTIIYVQKTFKVR